ncbi:DNA mismatch repair protein Msh3 [Frankliniella occidentalis]|uniref:DNA mismatch repair protein MSH3 n=1 Tax=Frankliniella occidentalis TaxID=133901 RepID=A0A6J1TAB1_FRAOC|nr:DNA mismatch repair protein Msh3 [Frankliniella occidentalis]
MSKPNFWRLKRKAKDNAQSVDVKTPKISQKTISSFFRSKPEPTNLLGGQSEKEDSESSQSSSQPKRQKLQDESCALTLEKVPVKLSDSALSKLQSFSTSSKSYEDNETIQSNLRPAKNIPKTSSACNGGRTKPDDDSENEDDPDTVVSSNIKFDAFRSNSQGKRSSQNVVCQGKTGKVKYTPLEQQVMDLWKQHPGILLFIECGYKYRFFGNDAEIAAQELNIYAHMDHNFMTASIPVHRLHAHVARLVEKGHKVGIVKQSETAALKAMSDNKNAPFTRKLENLFTRATLIGEDVDSIDQQNLLLDGVLSAGHIFCLNETHQDAKTTNIIFVAINPSTGECTYEQFSDNSGREELHKRLQMINPAEILCPPAVSKDTERLLNHSQARIEKLPLEWFETTSALTRVTSYFAKGNYEAGALEGLTDLPSPVLACLAAIQQHLEEFGLHRAIRPDCLQALPSGKGFLHLDSSTIRNLQLFTNDCGSGEGSLFWALNHTKTKFGARLLHKWIAQPVCNREVLEDRQEKLTELLQTDHEILTQLKGILSNLPDIEKGLTTILHNKCNPIQYYTILEALCTMRSDLLSLSTFVEQENNCPLLFQLIKETVALLDDVQAYRDNINVTAAKEGNKTKLLKDFSAFPNVLKFMSDIKDTTGALDDLRPEIASKLSLFSVQYTSVSGQEYLIEVKNTNAKCVPANWRKISSTKQVGRYRPPAVDKLFGELQCLREMLKTECNQAWIGLLQEFSQQYFRHKQAVNKVATMDVLLSLAHVAQQEGYCRPKIVEGDNCKIIIKKGRHPVIPLLLASAGQFVPNDTQLDSAGECCMVLSGPNMGGKSCYIRQVALIALLAHIGSYVPAEYAEISLLDSIFTRMGARDELFHGRSTLMVELEETAAILQKVSRNSLVLLDELGRGTGSCDGSAIACATLRHIAIEINCLSLFVTHYPSVMDTANELDKKAANYHMSFVLHNQDETEFLTFLYEVTKGAADRSYGINVARLANLDRNLLQRAATIAADLEKQARQRRDLRHSFSAMWNEHQH